jgi:hypothetical protein
MMRSSFIALAGSVVVLYALALIAGLVVDGRRWFVVHFALGLCAVVFTLLTHCVVMTYLIASGKMVRIAVEQSRLDTDYIVRTKELKAQTFPFMIGAILLLLATVLYGGAATDRAGVATFHLIAALFAAGYNTFTFVVEFRIITRHVALNTEVFALHNQVLDGKQQTGAAA